jgi:Transglycosylase SLT domain
MEHNHNLVIEPHQPKLGFAKALPQGRSFKHPICAPGKTLLFVVLMGGFGGALTEANTKPASLDLKGTIWDRVGNRYRLDPYLLYAVALTESARVTNGFAEPWPLAIQHQGKAFYPDDHESARQELKRRLMTGDPSIDVGIMQVNLRWHGHRVSHPEALLDRDTNIDLGARIIREGIQSVPGNPVFGIGRYHAWQNRRVAEVYGRKVIRLAYRLKHGTTVPGGR